ncbi:sn-1-specific diacylglycerol lipase ABHD11 [Parasteatoda tepidariorum]|uniref:sn-1-specific diacylglycerol lipase ABHD11 n=1 Tax=Parasteatoda tepidariorum TaxID=114398 RepID=UPI00077F8336|nr:protein ABHD11 [Parasteatoda tepidariorum]
MEASKAVSLSFEYVDPTGGVKDKKSPVIFLHAMLCSKEIWTDIPKTVANITGRRVYTYDARNHGKTTHANESDFSFSFNVEDLFLLMDEIRTQMPEQKPEKFVLVGHDMGGMTAIRAALKEPARFEMIFIMEMYAKPVSNELIKRTKQFMTTWTKCVQELPEGTLKEDVTRLSVENLYAKLEQWMKEDKEKASYLKGTFEYKKTAKGWDASYNTDALAKALEHLEKHQEDYQGEYDGPTYFLYGTESHYKINETKDSMKKHFPKAELVPFEKGSHIFVADMPAELAKTIGEKLNSV